MLDCCIDECLSKSTEGIGMYASLLIAGIFSMSNDFEGGIVFNEIVYNKLLIHFKQEIVVFLGMTDA